MGQFFDSNPADRAPSGAKEGRWSKDLPRNWRVALDLPGEEAHATPDHPGADIGYRLGPEHGTLSLRTGRHGAAAKAGHDLLIHATRWQATLVVGDDSVESSLALDIDGGSMRVIEGTGGMKSLSDAERLDIQTTIDDEILKRQPIVFRSTRVEPSADGSGLRVEGDLTLLGVTRPLEFDVALGEDGTVTADTVITQSLWDITPYSALFGTLKVNDDVAVAIEAKLPQSV